MPVPAGFVSVSPPRIALIGLGGYGQTHLRLLRECAARGECQIVSAVAVPGTSAEELAELPMGTRCYDSFGTWLAAEHDRFDLCFLPTPIYLHTSMTLDACAAGGSVLVEKPLAASWPELERLITADPAPGRFLAVGFQDLYLPPVHALQEALLSGRHGRLRHIRVLGQWPRTAAYYQRNNWAGRLHAPGGPVLDSPFNNALAHFLMLALFLAGEAPGEAAVVVSGDAELYRTRPIESFDTGFLRLRTRANVDIFCAMSHSGHIDEPPCIRIETDAAVIEWHVWREVWVTPTDGATEVTTLPTMDETRLSMFRQLCRRARGEAVPVCSLRLAAVHAAAILDLHAGCRIADAPAGLLWRDGAPTVEFSGVDDLLRRTFATGRLPGELGVPWAQSVQSFPAPYSARLAALTSDARVSLP